MPTKVVNIHQEKCSKYIGRSRTEEMHFGNPFFTKKGKATLGVLEMPNLYECLKAFNDWLEGTAHQDIEPKRRQWILDNLETLRNETIGCFCKPKGCHGDIYRVRLGEMTLEEVLGPLRPRAAPVVEEASQLGLF
jgi:hypothetical protein